MWVFSRALEGAASRLVGCPHKPIHTSLEAVLSPSGPRQSECRQNSFYSAEKDMSMNRYNRIATPKKKWVISLRQRNKYVNFAMKACDIIMNRPFSGPQLSFPHNHITLLLRATIDYLLKPVYRKLLVTSQLYVVFSALHVLGKLICCPREFD